MAQDTSHNPSKLSTELMLKFIVDSMVSLGEKVSDMEEMLVQSLQEPINTTPNQEEMI